MNTLLKKGLTLELAVGSFPAALYATKYLNSGALALMFISDDGIYEPLAKASLNIEGVSENLAYNEFVCKDYSENEGMFEYFVDSGLAEETGRGAIFGHASGPILRLNAELSAILKESMQ